MTDDQDIYDAMVKHAHALASLALASYGEELTEAQKLALDVGIKAGVTGTLAEIRDRGWKLT